MSPATALPNNNNNNNNSGVGPCEVDDPHPLWAKMSSASGTNKKRKKTDTKPQSQVNKCLNEKRRREQENTFIEELAELISASFADMSSLSVKPDKCAILQETVSQIRRIKEQEAEGSNAVQQGEVSSSKPNILTNELFGPLLLEALEGFLFVVNTEGKVEFVTDNVSQFIKYTKEEILGMTIYNILHHGDHTRFSSSLLPMSVGWGDQPKSKTFNSRFLVKPPDDSNETMEQKQQRVSKYENMQISCTQLPYSGGGGSDDDVGGDAGPCLMCVARRIPPNEKHIGAPIEQFTMKLDISGVIIDVDTTGVSQNYAQYLNKDLKNRSLKELCHSADLNKLTSHLKEAIQSPSGTSTSPIYRLRVGQDKHVHVQTKSKLFKASMHEPDFIMATHSIIGDSDTVVGDLTSQSSPSSQASGQSSSSFGGPLISSVNGSNSRLASSMDLTNTITLNNSTTFHSVTLNSTDIGFEFDIFPSSTWGDLVSGGGSSGEERGWDRGAGTPSQSPLYSASTPSHPALPFSPLGTEHSEDNDPPEGTDSAKLRTLLTKRPSSDSDTDSSSAKNRILKNLLNQEDEEAEQVKPNAVASNSAGSNAAANNMLLKLLNEKSDDDDVEARAGLKKQNELLQQLLKEEENNQENQQNEDPLFKGLGGRSGSPSSERSGRKRPSSEEEDHGGKRGLLEQQPQSQQQHASKLWEKNKMLASLLAKQPSTPATIPHIPASVISATPQDKMPRLIKPPPGGGSTSSWSGGGIGGNRPGPRMTSTGSRPSSLSAVPPSQVQGGFQQSANQWDQSSSDPILSDLLDQVIEIVPEAVTDSPALISMMSSETPVTLGTSPASVTGFTQDLINEKMAINAIQKSLMQCESAVKSPVYTNSVMTGSQQQSQQQFPPPPMYPQGRQRFQGQLQQGSVAARQPNQFIAQQQQQQQLLQQRNKLIQVQQQKQRLLQQQQQQQLLIPSNAAAANSDPGLHNIGSLINDSVAPNVSLQRSSSVPDSQLSPVGSYAGATQSLLNSASSQISPGQRQQPYSPQPFSPVSYQSQGGNSGGGGAQQGSQQSRLSPSGLSNYQQPQLSPRVSQGQQGFPSQGNTWSQQQASRLSLQQQQNPMLNAQLAASSSGFTGGGGTGSAGVGRFASLPPVRSLTSPGSRQSPFPGEHSPTSATPSYQYRLQRSISGPPQATTQLPGVGRQHHHHHQPQQQQQHHHQAGQSPHQPPHPQQAYGKEVGYHPPPHQSPLVYPHHHHHQPPPHHHQQHHHQEYYDPHLYPTTASSIDRPPRGGGSNGMTEYVRQELRAMVGARTSAGPQQRSQHSHQQDIDDLGITYVDISPTVNDSPKMWGSLADLGASSPQPGTSPHTPRNSVEEVSRTNDQKSSLLQKLLSE